VQTLVPGDGKKHRSRAPPDRDARPGAGRHYGYRSDIGRRKTFPSVYRKVDRMRSAQIQGNGDVCRRNDIKATSECSTQSAIFWSLVWMSALVPKFTLSMPFEGGDNMRLSPTRLLSYFVD
jgi:hypothetical protein